MFLQDSAEAVDTKLFMSAELMNTELPQKPALLKKRKLLVNFATTTTSSTMKFTNGLTLHLINSVGLQMKNAQK